MLQSGRGKELAEKWNKNKTDFVLYSAKAFYRKVGALDAPDAAIR